MDVMGWWIRDRSSIESSLHARVWLWSQALLATTLLTIIFTT